MKKNQLFRKIPTLDLFERLVKIYGLIDINDCRKFTRETLIKNRTLEKFEGFRDEMEEYYIPCKGDKYLNGLKVLQYSLEKNVVVDDYVNYNLKIIEF